MSSPSQLQHPYPPLNLQVRVATKRKTSIVVLKSSQPSPLQLPTTPLAGRFDISIQNLGPDIMTYSELQANSPALQVGTQVLSGGFAEENVSDEVILYGASAGTSTVVIVEHA